MKYARFKAKLNDGPNDPNDVEYFDVPIDEADLSIPHEIVEY